MPSKHYPQALDHFIFILAGMLNEEGGHYFEMFGAKLWISPFPACNQSEHPATAKAIDFLPKTFGAQAGSSSYHSIHPVFGDQAGLIVDRKPELP
jgi:hypothetical protein